MPQKNDNLKVGILTLGCPKNIVDSEILLAEVGTSGYDITFDVTNCDIAVVNSCAFINDAIEETFDMINVLLELKNEGRIKHIIVTGCLPQRYPDNSINGVDAYIGSHQIKDISSVIKKLIKGEEVQFDISNRYNKDFLLKNNVRFPLTGNTVRYVKIAEGCSHSCSFCSIPSIKGKYQSKPMNDIIEEVKILADTGAKEIILVAQDTSFYGTDIYGKKVLDELIYKINEIDGIEWIRLLYMYPKNITEDLIKCFKNCGKLCNYIDLSLQHINNEILKSMRRGVTKEEVTDIINRLRVEIDSLFIRTTFIVGYPGETYEQFNELLNFIEDMKFERMGAFIYSKEEGTPAAELTNEVSFDIQKSRFQDIMLLQQRISEENNKKLAGKIFRVLVTGKNIDKPGYLYGRAYFDAPEVDGLIYVRDTGNIKINNFYDVKITGTEEYDLTGVVI